MHRPGETNDWARAQWLSAITKVIAGNAAGANSPGNNAFACAVLAAAHHQKVSVLLKVERSRR
jgi:hypothetical protein